MRYLCIVQYKGTNYCGWQSQTVSKIPSIQEEVERVLSKLLNTEIKVYASGRTDAGVHALGQTFHFDTTKEIDSYKFVHGFNELVNNKKQINNATKMNIPPNVYFDLFTTSLDIDPKKKTWLSVTGIIFTFSFLNNGSLKFFITLLLLFYWIDEWQALTLIYIMAFEAISLTLEIVLFNLSKIQISILFAMHQVKVMEKL